MPFQGMGSSDAADPLGGQLFAEDVRTHIPRAWAVDDDEDYADTEVRGCFRVAAAKVVGVVAFVDGDVGDGVDVIVRW